MSNLLGLTRREIPANFINSADQYLIRAGYFHHIGQRDFIALPLGKKSLERLQRSLLENIQSDHYQPVQLSGTDNEKTLLDHLLEVCSNHIRSYRHLPIHLLNIQRTQFPETHAKISEILRAESHIKIKELIRKSLKNAEISESLF